MDASFVYIVYVVWLVFSKQLGQYSRRPQLRGVNIGIVLFSVNFVM